MMTLALLAIPAVGCQQPHGQAYSGRDTNFQPLNLPGQSRSLALASPRLTEALAEQADGSEPWYAGRNDERPAVIAGYESPTFDTVGVRTIDRTTSFSGRVREHFHETRYRWRERHTTH